MKEHLIKSDLFSQEEVARILPYFIAKRFKKKDLIVRAGDVTHHVFFVQKGCVRLFLVDRAAKEHSILFGTEGYWMGDLEAFMNHSLASYNYQALEETELMMIHRSSWDQLMKEEPSFSNYVGVLFRNALIMQQNRIVEFFTLTAEERYHNLIQNRKQLLERVPQKYLASYIGITPEFFSQIRKKQLGA